MDSFYFQYLLLQVLLEKEICDTTFGYAITCAQRKKVSVTVSIYSMDGSKVYEVTEEKMCPGSYSFTWDGTMNTGYGGYPPESNIAPAGLYTFDVNVSGPAYYDADGLRSKTLTVVPGPVEYYGYDDGGTPDDESDDGYFYYIRWYRLMSSRDASYGEIWLYDPDFLRVASWLVPSLGCVEHGYADGLRATPEGLLHGVILRVPVSLMEKAGIYRFVLHFYDNYADSYKNHQVKAMLEVNALLSSDELHIWIDTYNKPDFMNIAYWWDVERAFATVARLPAVVHSIPTNGPIK